MKTKSVYLNIAVIFVFILLAFLVDRPYTTDNAILIGLITSLSGEYVDFGTNIYNGALLAYEDYRAAHPNVNIELITENDGFDSKRGLSVYQKLTNIDKIDALINATSPTIGAIYESVITAGIPAIQVGEQTRDPLDDNVFQIMPGNLLAEKALGEYISSLDVDELALVYTNNDTLIRFKDAFLGGFDGEIDEFIIDPDETDFRTHALKIMESEPQHIALIMFPETGARLTQELLRTADLTDVQLYFDGNFQSGINDYDRILGGLEQIDGALVGAIGGTFSDTFVTNYTERFGSPPGFAADWGYDAFTILTESYDPEQKQWIQNINNSNKFPGVTGPFSFDLTGVREPIFSVQTIIDGELVNL